MYSSHDAVHECSLDSVHECSLDSCYSFYHSKTKHDVETKLTSLFSVSLKTLAVHGYKSWVTNLLIIPGTLGLLTANITYCRILLECINESPVNMCIV